MTDPASPAAPTASPPPFPTLGQRLVRALAQKALTAAAAVLTGYGLLRPGDQGAFVGFGIGLVLWIASFLWTFVHEDAEHTNRKLLDSLMSAALANLRGPLGS